MNRRLLAPALLALALGLPALAEVKVEVRAHHDDRPAVVRRVVVEDAVGRDDIRDLQRQIDALRGEIASLRSENRELRDRVNDLEDMHSEEVKTIRVRKGQRTITIERRE